MAAEFKCIRCDGGGRMKIGVHADSAVRSIEIACIDCDGGGAVKYTEEKQRALKAAMDAAWCHCDSRDPIYVPDTPGLKHHWDCGKCGGLVQMG